MKTNLQKRDHKDITAVLLHLPLPPPIMIKERKNLKNLTQKRVQAMIKKMHLKVIVSGGHNPSLHLLLEIKKTGQCHTLLLGVIQLNRISLPVRVALHLPKSSLLAQPFLLLQIIRSLPLLEVSLPKERTNHYLLFEESHLAEVNLHHLFVVNLQGKAGPLQKIKSHPRGKALPHAVIPLQGLNLTGIVEVPVEVALLYARGSLLADLQVIDGRILQGIADHHHVEVDLLHPRGIGLLDSVDRHLPCEVGQ